MEKKFSVRVFRESPFTWQSKNVIRKIQKEFPGRKSTARLAVYTVLTQIASDSSGDEYETWGIKIMEMSGVGYKALRNILKDFEKMKIIEKFQDRNSDGTYGRLKIILTELNDITTDRTIEPDGQNAGTFTE